MRKTTSTMLTALLALLALVTYARSAGYTVISNTYESQTTVTPGLPLTVGPDKNWLMTSGTAAQSISVGQAFDLPIDVTNPNNQTLNVMLLLTITNPQGISTNDVFVKGASPYLSEVDSVAATNTSLVFLIHQDSTVVPYFRLDPGQFRVNLTILTIQYNVIGTYTYDISVVT